MAEKISISFFLFSATVLSLLMSKMGRKDFSRRDRLRWSWVIRLTCYTLKRFIWRKKDATEKGARISSNARYPCKVEKKLKGSLDLIPSPSVKIQIMGGKVCLRCKGKTLQGVANNLLKKRSLLTSPSNFLPYYLK